MPKPKRNTADLFATALHDVYLCGYVTEPVEVAPSVWSATHTGHGYNLCAYELAARLPGQLWPGRRSVSWVCGRGGPHGRLIDPDDVPRLQTAQDTLAALGIRPEMPWSTGRLARAALQWVTEPSRCPAQSDHLLNGISVGYHSCEPGTYKGLALWDVKSYYYRLLERAPSPRVMVSKRNTDIAFGALSPAEKSRWKEMLSAVGSDKVLRNSVVGAAMGAKGFRAVYMGGPGRPINKRGEPVDGHEPSARAHRSMLKLPGGDYRGLGVLIIRSAYELCAEASLQSDSVYSTIDSVANQSTLPPEVWRRYGLDSELKASGLAEIVGRGNWKIGNLQTKPYRAGYRNGERVARAPIPDKLYSREWL